MPHVLSDLGTGTNGEQVDSPAALIRDALRVLFPQPGQVVELRAPKCPNGPNGRYKSTASGYFDDHKQLAEYAETLDVHNKPPGIYITINELDPALLARRTNRLEFGVDTTTADAAVVRRRLLLDFDWQRPQGISTTDDQHAAALQRARECGHWLSDQRGWPQGILADSGNGAHLLYGIDLPNDPANALDSKAIVDGCLRALAAKFDDPGSSGVFVDTSVGNAARICKLYGTMARMGDDTSTYPHRRSRLLTVPQQIVTVTV
jgi:hypothetical protein